MYTAAIISNEFQPTLFRLLNICLLYFSLLKFALYTMVYLLLYTCWEKKQKYCINYDGVYVFPCDDLLKNVCV